MDYIKNELYKHNFNPINKKNGKCVYFSSKNMGKTIKLHQSVFCYFSSDNNNDNNLVINHKDHNTLNNTIDNLEKIHLAINSMNNLEDIRPRWEEKGKRYRVEYVIEFKRNTVSFSVKKYGTKIAAYNAAKEYIDNVVVNEKIIYLKNKEVNLYKQNLKEAIKYFISNNQIDVIENILNECGYYNEVIICQKNNYSKM